MVQLGDFVKLIGSGEHAGKCGYVIQQSEIKDRFVIALDDTSDIEEVHRFAAQADDLQVVRRRDEQVEIKVYELMNTRFLPLAQPTRN
jgi:hypothetical protein